MILFINAAVNYLFKKFSFVFFLYIYHNVNSTPLYQSNYAFLTNFIKSKRSSNFDVNYYDQLIKVKRFRREFMYVASSSGEGVLLDNKQTASNTSQIIDDAKCFKECNNEWHEAFEKRFDMRMADFYDFPFHPKILDYTNFVAYCELAEQQNHCYIEKCNDASADRIFSPSNFLCSFKRNQFIRTRSCFEETEPLTFLKCDQRCHKNAAARTESQLKRAAISAIQTTATTTPGTTEQIIMTELSKDTAKLKPNSTEITGVIKNITTNISSESTDTLLKESKTNITHVNVLRKNIQIPISDNEDVINISLKASQNPPLQQTRSEAGKIFVKSEMDNYELELDLLCTFQECYKECHESILKEICAPSIADSAIDLITSFVNWHATDVHDWHMITQNADLLPKSCARLAESAFTTSTATGIKTQSLAPLTN